MKKIAYLSPYNSTTAEAAQAIGKRGYGFLECITPTELINSIDDDTYGVLPLQDCIDASASESLNALIDTDKSVWISKKFSLVPDFRLFVSKGVFYNDITRIKTPAFVYEMCRQNIKDIFTQKYNIEFVSSTDSALKELDETTCAIAPAINIEKHPNLVMGQASIADSDSPSIYFGYLTNDSTVSKDSKTTLVVITLDNSKGAISLVADAFYSQDIKINHFKTHSITDDKITILVELAINARAKSFKDAISSLESDLLDTPPDDDNSFSANVQEQSPIKPLDTQNQDNNIPNSSNSPQTKNKIKILGCF